MIGATGAIGCPAQSEDDHIDSSTGSSKYLIIGSRHAVGVVDKVLCVLQGWSAEAGINEYRYTPTGTAAYELRRALKRRPLRCDWNIALYRSRRFGAISWPNRVIHRENLLCT